MTSKEFLMDLPARINAKALEGMSTNFHFIFDEDSSNQLTVKVEGGKLSIIEGLVDTADCIIKASDEDFKKILKGEINPMMAILTGKLKISNQAEMMKFGKLLGWM